MGPAAAAASDMRRRDELADCEAEGAIRGATGVKAATREAETRARKADATKENRAMVVVVIRAMLFCYMGNISLDIEH